MKKTWLITYKLLDKKDKHETGLKAGTSFAYIQAETAMGACQALANEFPMFITRVTSAPKAIDARDCNELEMK